jgi:hypothetical protein
MCPQARIKRNTIQTRYRLDWAWALVVPSHLGVFCTRYHLNTLWKCCGCKFQVQFIQIMIQSTILAWLCCCGQNIDSSYSQSLSRCVDPTSVQSIIPRSYLWCICIPLSSTFCTGRIQYVRTDALSYLSFIIQFKCYRGLALFTTKSVMTKGLEGLVTNLRIFRKPNLTLLIALNM